jgi:hypothetical protein
LLLPQAIEAPALAVMVPLLIRGLRESTPIQRKCCVITTNMAKLVNSPLDAAHFLPALVPGAPPATTPFPAAPSPPPSPGAAAQASIPTRRSWPCLQRGSRWCHFCA